MPPFWLTRASIFNYELQDLFGSDPASIPHTPGSSREGLSPEACRHSVADAAVKAAPVVPALSSVDDLEPRRSAR